MANTFAIAGREIAPGSFERFEIPVARLYNQLEMTIPVLVAHGHKPGPRLCLSATVHGDELLGLAILIDFLKLLDRDDLAGTLVVVPLVNAFGLLQQSRYLPDRRDLNRSFPGSKKGPLASRIAYLILNEVISKCTHCIDLHTGSNHRTNYPQIRADLKNNETLAMAQAFGAPVMIQSGTRDGSLRAAAGELGLPSLLFEAGEPLRHNAEFVKIGIEGIFGVMKHLKMTSHGPTPNRTSQRIGKSKWVRAPESGYLVLEVKLGQPIEKDQPLGEVKTRGAQKFFEETEKPVVSPIDGIVIGQLLNPLVHQGDAILHIGIPDEN